MSRPGIVERMTAWRHALHRRPELGFEESETSDFVAERLEEMGLEVTRGIGGTGVVGVLRRGASDRAVGFRAELDALAIHERNEFRHRSEIDGRMHACGHDGHTAMLLGGACQLIEAGEFDGAVHFIFQPAEEHGRGAQAMLEDGLFERFPMGAVYALHNWPALPQGVFAVRAGVMMASEDNFEIRVIGQGGHASSPHLIRDPLPAAAEIILALQTIVSRTVDPLAAAVVSVTGVTTDGARNAIPSRALITGDCRSFAPDVQAAIEDRIRRIARGVAEAHGITCEVDYTRDFVAVVNSVEEARLAASVAEGLFGASKVIMDAPPVMASEDFAHMLRRKPGAYILIGNGTGETFPCSLHNAYYDFNDSLLPIGAEFWRSLAQKTLAV